MTLTKREETEIHSYYVHYVNSMASLNEMFNVLCQVTSVHNDRLL